jgi:hypothetical protein
MPYFPASVSHCMQVEDILVVREWDQYADFIKQYMSLLEQVGQSYIDLLSRIGGNVEPSSL